MLHRHDDIAKSEILLYDIKNSDISGWMTLSFKQVRYFVAAAEAGQISQAAVELNVSQSAVTAAVQQLEGHLGTRLFHRTPSGVALTPEGGRFLHHARNIMAAVSEAMRGPRGVSSAVTGRVRVGVTYTVCGYFLTPHLARFTRNFPGIAVDLQEGSRAYTEKAVIEGALDLGVILVSNLENRRQLRADTLFRSRRRLWLPADHPLLRRPQVTLADVASEPYVMLTVDEANDTSARYWSHTAHRPNIIFRTSSIEAVRSMVAAGMGVSILSDMVYRPWSLEGQRIETREVAADIPTMDVGIVCRPGVTLPHPAQALRDFFVLSFQGGSPGFAGSLGPPSPDHSREAGPASGG